ncbi:unnamed protein product [Heterobilharzia americana]|nr:unnamed protein product [Heterobilharzia americana]
MSGAFDRTGEFRACTQSFHDRFLSGRLRLNPPHPKYSNPTENSVVADLLIKSKQMSKELKMTVSKITKLKLLLQNASNSSPEVLGKLIEVIQYDIMDLNKAKFELKANLSVVKERLTTSMQHLKHIDLIVIGLEYHLSFLVSEFRILLEEHKSFLSASSKMSNSNILVNTDLNSQFTKSASFSGLISPGKSNVANAFQSLCNISCHPTENKQSHQANQYPNNSLTYAPSSSVSNSRPTSNLSSVTPITELNTTSVDNRSVLYDPSHVEMNDHPVEQVQLLVNNSHISLIDQEVRQRDAAIRRVESTIVQLGEIYQQFSSLVQEQSDLVLRIDSQTDDMEMNISEAHVQLLAFMRRISAQRAFLIKMSECTDNSCDKDVGNEKIQLPSKRHYRQRAHCNPWSDHTLDYPLKPDLMDWEKLFGGGRDVTSSGSEGVVDPVVRFLDVGCGYGGLLFNLSTSYPFTRSVGLEIRLKVCDFVREKLNALRLKCPGQYNNITCIRTNAMKFLPNFFHKAQLHKIFFLYPDPHFKRVKHKWRIISPTLLDVYAYLLSPGGKIYSATDVPDLGKWIVDCLSAHPLFRPVCHVHLSPKCKDTKNPNELLKLSSDPNIFEDGPYFIKDTDSFQKLKESDSVLKLLEQGCTEEAHKACREGRETVLSVYERISYPLL